MSDDNGNNENGNDNDDDDNELPPFILFKGPKLIELGYADTVEEYGLDCLDLKIKFYDDGKWYIDLVDTETGEIRGHYNESHCPDPLNPECDD